MAETKVKRSIKDAAKKNNMDVCKILAKELIQSKKAKNRIYTSKAQLNSVGMQMKNQLCKYNRCVTSRENVDFEWGRGQNGTV